MLCETDILYLLELLAQEVIIEPSDKFPFRVTRRAVGYSENATVGHLQAALSIMLEAVRRKEQK